MNILDDLYYGNINISAMDIKDIPELKEALDGAAKSEEELRAKVNDECLEVLKCFVAENDRLIDVLSRSMFAEGFKCGMRLTVAGMIDRAETFGKDENKGRWIIMK